MQSKAFCTTHIVIIVFMNQQGSFVFHLNVRSPSYEHDEKDTFTNSKGSGELAHSPSLIRAWAVCKCILFAKSQRSGPTWWLPVHVGPGHAKPCLMPYVNNKGTDQPARLQRYRSACASAQCDHHLCCSLDSTICILAISNFSRF